MTCYIQNQGKLLLGPFPPFVLGSGVLVLLTGSWPGVGTAVHLRQRDWHSPFWSLPLLPLPCARPCAHGGALRRCCRTSQTPGLSLVYAVLAKSSSSQRQFCPGEGTRTKTHCPASRQPGDTEQPGDTRWPACTDGTELAPALFSFLPKERFGEQSDSLGSVVQESQDTALAREALQVDSRPWLAFSSRLAPEGPSARLPVTGSVPGRPLLFVCVRRNWGKATAPQSNLHAREVYGDTAV